MKIYDQKRGVTWMWIDMHVHIHIVYTVVQARRVYTICEYHIFVRTSTDSCMLQHSSNAQNGCTHFCTQYVRPM